MNEDQKERVYIFDTTLRDGEQSPGCSMNTKEKIRLALKLEEMGVDVIEAGFPATSPGDFEAVSEIAKAVKRCQVAALCMADENAVDYAWAAIKHAGERARIHTFIATSAIHLEHKLKISEEEALERAVKAVKRARLYTENVEFSFEDATRTRKPFLVKMATAVIDAGAKVIDIPDTVGYRMFFEMSALIRLLRDCVSNIDQAIISVHCHNDLGLAAANSLAAVLGGARQVHLTVNSIGERAGNSSLEEFVMALKVRGDVLPYRTKVNSECIVPVSKLLVSITGMQVQANKPIVGANAFAHEAGIHQHGVLNNRETYEIMTPESVGLTASNIVLGKHSGRHALRDRLAKLGHNLTKPELDVAFRKFKELCDDKKVVFDEDLDAIILDGVTNGNFYHIEELLYNGGSFGRPSAVVRLDCGGETKRGDGSGDGPVDAILKIVKRLTGTDFTLKNFGMDSITDGSDAQATCIATLEGYGRKFNGRGTDTDIVIASAKAYVSALNKIKSWELRYRQEESCEEASLKN